MRVIAGRGKGIKLKAPKGYHTRPTADRVKEAVFNILGAKVIDAFFLDLFGGTGAMAIEAISRGAARAVICEKDKTALSVIEENINKVKFNEQIKLLRQDASMAIKALAKTDSRFHIIYLDPPYAASLLPKILHLLSQYQLLAEGGIIVAETSIKENISGENLPFEIVDTRRYGDTVLFILIESNHEGDKKWN